MAGGRAMAAESGGDLSAAPVGRDLSRGPVGPGTARGAGMQQLALEASAGFFALPQDNPVLQMDRAFRGSQAGRHLLSLWAAARGGSGVPGEMAAIAVASYVKALQSDAARDWVAKACGWRPGAWAADAGLFPGAAWIEPSRRFLREILSGLESDEDLAFLAENADQRPGFQVIGERAGVAAVLVPVVAYLDSLTGESGARIVDLLALDPAVPKNYWNYTGMGDAYPQPLEWWRLAQTGKPFAGPDSWPRAIRLYRYPLDLLRATAPTDDAQPDMAGRLCVLDWNSPDAADLLDAIDEGAVKLVCDDEAHLRQIKKLIRPARKALDMEIEG